MEDKAPGFTENVLLWGSIILAWATGEAGRILIAGGLGGVTRWMMSDRKSIISGIIQVTSGAMTAHYLWPWTHAAVLMVFGQIGDPADSKVTAAYVSGILGISAAKIILAIIEARAKKLEGSDNG